MFRTIREIAREGIISQNHLRQLVAAGKCPGIRVGNRFMVNRELLIEYLNAESRKSQGGGEQVSKTGNARPTVGAAERAEAGKVLEDIHSRSYCTSTPATKQPQISDLLSTGQENALPLRHLETITGRDGRSIRLEIESARRNGIPILSDGGGYYLPATRAEVGRFVRQMRGRAKEILATAAAVEQCSAITMS